MDLFNIYLTRLAVELNIAVTAVNCCLKILIIVVVITLWAYFDMWQGIPQLYIYYATPAPFTRS